MNTLEQLQSGKLNGAKTLRLSCNLNEFPKEIFSLSETLEILDLSNNQLSSLPDNFNELKKLKIAFFSENKFTEFPKILSQSPNLTMIGFKSNHISHIPEEAFPIHLQWLILTNNKIKQLPKSIGKCFNLQKIALAGNQLSDLPSEMMNCKNIELLRISANQLSDFPEFLFSLPRLSWLAFSGNPFCSKINFNKKLPNISWKNIEIKEKLGEGASGIISKAIWHNNETKKNIAIKIFKGEVTSDGFPIDEMQACIIVGKHPSLVTVIGSLIDHPENKLGLILELIPSNFKNLGEPPSFNTCTRDTFKPGSEFSLYSILKIIKSIASVLSHLHLKGISHGDLYAHNTLVDDDANTIFGDFGAASFYNINSKNALLFQKIDVRAFGCMLEDLLNLVSRNKHDEIVFTNLLELKNSCLNERINDRPTFNEIIEILTRYKY